MPDPEGDAPSTEGLPPGIAESIAISNAQSIGEQPAILANLALANQIANANLAQQYALANQQALFQVQLAVVAKCVEVISRIDPTSPIAHEQLRTLTDLVTELTGKLHAAATPPAAEPKEESHGEAAASSTGSASSGGSTLESLSGDALATAFAVLNAILGGGQKKEGGDKPRE